MFDTFSKDIIYLHLPAPYRQTLFVELIQFQPGSDGGATSVSASASGSASGSASASTSASASAPIPRPQIVNHQPMLGRQLNLNPHSFSQHHNPQPSTSTTAPHTSSGMSSFSASPTTHPSAPPPPPWSRWGTMSTPAMPPSTQRRNNGESSRSNGTPQPSASTSKKRKHVEEILIHQHQQQHLTEDEPRSSFPLKRHTGPALTPTPMSPPRTVQTLSPSLAMIVSPTNQAVHTSPRGNQLPPMRSGSNGSPVLPPVKSLIGGSESSRSS